MQSAMDQTTNWMWERSKYSNSPIHMNSVLPTAPPPASSLGSWEELAFAKDSAADLWGCIWPPRSYSCSFCCRVFRSAQALGGHMNVHRRDRARLKQEAWNQEENHNPNPTSNSAVAVFHEQIPLMNVSIDLKLGEMDCKRRREDCGVQQRRNNSKKLRSDDLVLALSRKSDRDGDLQLLKSEVLKLRACQADELDLELRLGDPPKVKQNCSIIIIE